MDREANTMRPVCRAAIGGLFALWLAPLAPSAPPCEKESTCAETRAAEPAAEQDGITERRQG